MTSLRTAHDFEHDVLRGMSVECARVEAARLAAKALVITDHLALTHYAPQSIVRQNLERERDALEWESHGISARIAEYQGQIEKVREPAAPMSMRARRARAR